LTSPPIIVFAGRFGSGKTEIALNYALRLVEREQSPFLVDLDIITPYFRTRERQDELGHRGVRVVSPFPVGRHIHVPAISPQIRGALEQDDNPVVIDLGGDAQGARAISPYVEAIRQRQHEVFFVVNPFRLSMHSVPSIARAICEIESSARLAVSALVSNPNLMAQSTLASFQEGHAVVRAASQVLDLPIAFAAVEKSLHAQVLEHYPTIDLLPIFRFFRMFDPPGATG
jgi:hypothetical protein